MTSLPGASPRRPQHTNQNQNQNQNQKKNQNPSMKEKQKKHPAPSRWSGEGLYTAGRACGKHLPELATKG